ncbi:MAG: TIGR01777 family oxidoreductase, partial [Terriglobales bacterium]
MPSSRILISGASGFIGSALIPALEARGLKVTRLVRGTVSPDGSLPWDPAKPLNPELVSGFDAVIHLAGEPVAARWTEAKKKLIRDSRVLGTKHLCEALAQAAQAPRVLISASAIGYYGDRGDEMLHEDSPWGDGFLGEVCRQWEAATKPAADAGIRAIQIRIGVVLSARGGALKEMLPPFRMGFGGQIGDGRQWMSWIHLEDLVGAILQVLDSESL